MLEGLKKEVCQANIELYRRGLVVFTWGNVSGIDRESGYVVIKPSGIEYDVMKPEDMVVVDMNSGNVIEGKWKPSSDTPTHLELYRSFTEIGGVAHTHSINAVAFAQAGRSIPILGTTHADYFYGAIPCTRSLTEEEVKGEYEANTGKVIVECLAGRNPLTMPGMLVRNHGLFTWGTSPHEAMYNSVVLETVSEMALKTISLNPSAKIEQYVVDKHYERKHGEKAYYGQDVAETKR